MPKFTPTTIGSTLSNTAPGQINQNLQRISEALENTLSRNGETPNQMTSDLDMNHNDLLNVKDTHTDRLFLNGKEVRSVSEFNPSDFATAEQGARADSALQPGDLDDVLPPISPNTILVDNEDGTLRESKDFREILGLLEVDVSHSESLARPVYTPTSEISQTRLLIEGSTENAGDPIYHRHFGSLVVDNTGVIHLFYRRALGHAGYFSGVLCRMTLDHNGNEKSPETVIYTPPLGWDLQAPMAVITPDGNVVVTFCDVETVASGGTGSVFKSFLSRDNCLTWTEPVAFASRPSARTYGQPRVCPSDQLNKRWMLLQPFYGRDATLTQRVIGLYKSYDGGRSWVTGPVIYQGADLNLDETAIAVLNAKVWFACIRKNSARLHWSVTSDSGASWTSPTEVTWGSTLDVAPSVDIITENGINHVLVGFCDRNSDQTKWRWAPASELMTNAESMRHAVKVTSASDMGSASGYQIPLIYPNGQMLFVEFREYSYNPTISDPVGTDVRLVWANPSAWVKIQKRSWTPNLTAKTTPGTPTFSVQSGVVHKDLNNLVHVNFTFTVSAKGGMAGQLTIDNLPYPVAAGVANQPTLNISFRSNLNATSMGTVTSITGVGIQGTTSVDFYKNTTSGSSNFNAADVDDGFRIYASMTYFTD